MGGAGAPPRLDYASPPPADPSRWPGRLGFVSCSICVALVAWFVAGNVILLETFYGGPGIPGASHWRWWLIVMGVGSGSALLGIGLAATALRRRDPSRAIPILGLIGCGIAFVYYAWGLTQYPYW